MATLILSSVGSALGGPVGGAIGALVGRAIDGSIIGQPKREGPRLTELAVTTSSYGQPVPRIFGTIRVPGTIVWATDLKESSQTSGAKGQPKTTSYNYSISFAIALASRPLASVGRVWADGDLLRGAAGDLKVGGVMRLYPGNGDEAPDPLIAAAQGAQACAFRGLAYVVFEDLELASFGNRIPTLSFEVIAPYGTLDIVDLLDGVKLAPDASVPLVGLTGFADEGGSRAALLQDVARVFPLASTVSVQGIRIAPVEKASPSALPEPIIGRAGTDNDRAAVTTRRSPASDTPTALRYYDAARDYQPSLQRAPGVGAEGNAIEFAGVFSASAARARIDQLRRIGLGAREILAYRIADPSANFIPGRCVTRTGDTRVWLVRSLELHADGVDLQLERIVDGPQGTGLADPGLASIPLDQLPGALRLRYFELPWDGLGAPNFPQRFAAVSQSGSRTGIALSSVENESLISLGISARGRAIQGECVSALAGSPSLLFEPHAQFDIALYSPQDQLLSVDEHALLDGANRLLVGEEVLQFRFAEPLGGGLWRLTGLLRGRGGTEHSAAIGHAAGTPVVLLDQQLIALQDGTHDEIGAESGLAKAEPVYATVTGAGASLRPLAPVHALRLTDLSGDPEWRWIRRARGAWRWLDGIDVPLVEEREAYRIGFGPVDQPVSQWDVSEPSFTLPASEWASLVASHPTESLWVRQIGSHALSLPALLPA